jgi:hypothetical protein
VLTSDRFDSLYDLLPLGIARFNENVSEGDTGFGVGREVVGRDLVEERDRVFLGEDEERVVGDGSSELVATFVESLVENDSGSLDVGGSGDGGIRRETKEVVISVEIGKVVERGFGGLVGFVDVSDNDNLVGSLELVVV